jgi:hypothetical protein
VSSISSEEDMRGAFVSFTAMLVSEALLLDKIFETVKLVVINCSWLMNNLYYAGIMPLQCERGVLAALFFK